MKHAIMIMAHNNFSVVSALLEQLDVPEFDIYIHINAKIRTFPQEQWQAKTHYAGLYFVPRVRVGYCDYSMVRAVMSLFRSATQKKYDYYHLISGADLLIKSREEFLRFFDENNGTEFVGFSDTFDEDRVRYRHFFTALCRQRSRLLSTVFAKARIGLVRLQKLFGISNKADDFTTVKKGTDWYSLTDDAVRYLISKEPLFCKHFRYAYCPTEFFPHTVLYNSHFRKNLNSGDECRQCMRTIDWNRGQPYTYTIGDKRFLLSSEGMFARKFDENKDMEIVEFFKDYVKG